MLKMDSFEKDQDKGGIGTGTREPAAGDQSVFEDFSYQRQLTRNTFLNRFECEPGPSPYDVEAQRQAQYQTEIRTARQAGPLQPIAPNYYTNHDLTRSGDPALSKLPVARDTNSANGEPAFKISAAFVVKDGITTRAVLDMPSDRLRLVKSGEDRKFAGADILLSQGDPVEAMQGGLVVYSSKKPERSRAVDLNGHIVPVGDLSRYAGNIVIVQSWDEKTSGLRYHIYSGLDCAAVIAGDRITSGQIIGKADTNGLHYEVHRRTVQGPAVKIEARRERGS